MKKKGPPILEKAALALERHSIGNQGTSTPTALMLQTIPRNHQVRNQSYKDLLANTTASAVGFSESSLPMLPPSASDVSITRKKKASAIKLKPLTVPSSDGPSSGENYQVVVSPANKKVKVLPNGKKVKKPQADVLDVSYSSPETSAALSKSNEKLKQVISGNIGQVAAAAPMSKSQIMVIDHVKKGESASTSIVP